MEREHRLLDAGEGVGREVDVLQPRWLVSFRARVERHYGEKRRTR